MGEPGDGEKEAPVLRLVPSSGYTIERGKPCRHLGLAVVEEQRTLTCKACGAVVDPFDVVLGYARSERSWQQWEAEERKCRARLVDLKDEERRTKARLKHARAKLKEVLDE